MPSDLGLLTLDLGSQSLSECTYLPNTRPCHMHTLCTTSMALASNQSGVRVCVQAAFLIPISVCVYTTTGGLKATFLSSYIHTVIIYVALCIFAFTVYATGSDLGSPSKVSTNLPSIVISLNAHLGVSLHLTVCPHLLQY